jgi:AraC-like DNA-binding protein
MPDEVTQNEKALLERRRRELQLEQRRNDRNLHLSMTEAAAAMGLSERSLYRRISEGKLTPIYDRGRTMIHADDVDLEQRIRDGLLFLGLPVGEGE